MKIDSSMMNTVATQSEVKKESVKTKVHPEIEESSNVLKNDIRNVQTSSFKKVEFKNFDDAVEALKSIKKALTTDPDATKEIHGSLNTENTQYLLRDE